MKKLFVALLITLFCVTGTFAAEKRNGVTQDGMGWFTLMDLCECDTVDGVTEVCVVEEIENEDALFQFFDQDGDGVADFGEGFRKIFVSGSLVYVYIGKGPGPTVEHDKKIIEEYFMKVDEHSKTCKDKDKVEESKYKQEDKF